MTHPDDLPRYQTNNPTAFKKRWEDNPEGTWFAQRLVISDEADRMHPVPDQMLVIVGSYRAAYEELIRRWPVRTLAQGFELEPINIINIKQA